MKKDATIPHFGHKTKQEELMNHFHQKMLEKGFSYRQLGVENGRFIHYQVQVMWEGFQLAHETIPLVDRGHFVLASMETGFPYFSNRPRIHRSLKTALEEMDRLVVAKVGTNFGMYQFVMTNEDIEQNRKTARVKLHQLSK